MAATNIKVFTLNCWGLPFPVICKNRPERIEAIGNYLEKEDFDVVFLQEIWVKSDFHKLKEKLKYNLPYSHYFYSGAIGSGLVIFSKHVILETFFHRFHLNGHAHKVFHGDWFGGKGIGMCKIHKDGLQVNLYTSHLHAEYNPTQDEYRAHRLSQLVEMCQFVDYTSLDCDLVVLGGDLNTPSGGLGWRMMTQNTELCDAWVEKKNQVQNESIGSSDVAGNSYTSSKLCKDRPNGERIDYLMFRNKNNYLVEVSECLMGHLGRIPNNTNVSYSDHEPLYASLKITKQQEESELPSKKKTELGKNERENLQGCLLALDKGISQCLREEKFFQLIVIFLSVALYLFTMYLDLGTCLSVVTSTSLALIKLTTTITIGFCVWIAMIVKRAEFHGLVACKEDLGKMLRL